MKHPFPGPGLAVRLLGEITREHLVTLREADAIVVEEIRRAGLYEKVWQAFAVFCRCVAWGHGRRPHLWADRGGAGGGVRRRHDGGLGAAAGGSTRTHLYEDRE